MDQPPLSQCANKIPVPRYIKDRNAGQPSVITRIDVDFCREKRGDNGKSRTIGPCSDSAKIYSESWITGPSMSQLRSTKDMDGAQKGPRF